MQCWVARSATSACSPRRAGDHGLEPGDPDVDRLAHRRRPWSPDKAFATVPVTLMIIGTALATGPAAWMIHSLGQAERAGSRAQRLAMPAALVAAFAAWIDWFWLFCAGACGCSALRRPLPTSTGFAAADSVPAGAASRVRDLMGVVRRRGRPVSSGRRSLSHTKDWIAGHEFAGDLPGDGGAGAGRHCGDSGRRGLAPTVQLAADRKAGRSIG